jgi:hypothetical protein
MKNLTDRPYSPILTCFRPLMWQNIEVPARAIAMPRSIILQQLLDGNSLSQAQSTDLMQGWLNGEIPPATSGAILMALQAKVLSAVELAGMAKVLQAPENSHAYPVIDTFLYCETIDHIKNFH